ncbi:MAG TPA: hypothetical protein VH478_23260 [Trebonia sp.]|nr:hypothetical protein [Trebonia sp.]
MRKLSRKFRIGLGAAILAAAGAAVAVAAPSFAATGAAPVGGTHPLGVTATPAASSGSGFIYGSDSDQVPVTGKAPWPMTHLTGSYGGYIGMAGNWARTEGCSTGNFLAWSQPNALQAIDNYVNHHIGVGLGVYWYMGGPGVDPHYNGTATEATAWGAHQAQLTLTAMSKLHITYPVVWADIELPGIKPAPDNGWNSVYTSSCSGVKKASSVPAAIDRDVFNGYANYITSHSTYKVGVYSEPGIWASIFGTGSASTLSNTYEWTYEPETASLSAEPSGWCLSQGKGACARFFGGITSASKYALMWQWSGGGGVRNPYGDYDQIDVSRMG